MRRLAFVGGDDVYRRVERVGQRLRRRWRRVEDDRRACGAASLRGGQHRLQRDLELQQEHARLLKRRRGGRHIGHGEAVVGARGHSDDVLPAGADDDQRDAGRGLLIPHDEARIQPLALEIGERSLAEHIAAHARHEGHAPPHARGGHRLVGALAPRRDHQIAPQHSLAGQGQARRLHDHIGVR